MSYTFCKDFIASLLKDVSSTKFGNTDVLLRSFERVRIFITWFDLFINLFYTTNSSYLFCALLHFSSPHILETEAFSTHTVWTTPMLFHIYTSSAKTTTLSSLKRYANTRFTYLVLFIKPKKRYRQHYWICHWWKAYPRLAIMVTWISVAGFAGDVSEQATIMERVLNSRFYNSLNVFLTFYPVACLFLISRSCRYSGAARTRAVTGFSWRTWWSPRYSTAPSSRSCWETSGSTRGTGRRGRPWRTSSTRSTPHYVSVLHTKVLDARRLVIIALLPVFILFVQFKKDNNMHNFNFM